MHCSSSNSIAAGISRSIIFSKTVLLVGIGMRIQRFVGNASAGAL